MLDVLRRNAGSWAIKIILSFIALTFIWWGVGTYTERDRNVAATVAGETITMGELAETVANIEKTYREVYGPAFTPEMAKTLDLKKQAMDSLIQRRLLLAEAGKMGLSATDDEVQREIAATPAFQADGVFREDRYRAVLSYNRVSPAEFEASKRTEITLKKMEGLLTAGALVPESEARALFQAASRKVRLLVVAADPGKIRGVEAPTEAEISAKYDGSKESFRIPARVKLVVATFTPESVGRDAQPTEAEIKAFYEGNSDRFRSEEQRLISRIVIPSGKKDPEAARRRIEEISREAAKGKAEFTALAKKYSGGKALEAWVTRKEAGAALGGPVFSAPVDTVVGPVDVGDGLALVRVNRIKFPETPPLSQVRDRVAAALVREKGKDLAVVKAYEAHPKAASGRDLKGTAASYGVRVTVTGWVGADDAGEIPPAVVQEALLLPAGEVGPVKTLGDAHYLFQVSEKEDSRVPSLAEVRGRVGAAVAQEKRVAAAQAALQQVLTASKTASELEANAKKAGLSADVTAWFAPASDPLPGGLTAAGEIRKDLSILSRKAPLSSKVYPAPGGQFLAVAFLGEQPATDAEFARKKDIIMRAMLEQKKASMMEAFLEGRRKEAKVEVNPEALK